MSHVLLAPNVGAVREVTLLSVHSRNTECISLARSFSLLLSRVTSDQYAPYAVVNLSLTGRMEGEVSLVCVFSASDFGSEIWINGRVYALMDVIDLDLHQWRSRDVCVMSVGATSTGTEVGTGVGAYACKAI